MANKFTYLIRSNELLISEIDKGVLFWKGKPKQIDVKFVIPEIHVE